MFVINKKIFLAFRHTLLYSHGLIYLDVKQLYFCSISANFGNRVASILKFYVRVLYEKEDEDKMLRNASNLFINQIFEHGF